MRTARALLALALTLIPALAARGQEVTMSLGEYNALRTRATLPPPPTPAAAPPAAPWALESASVEVTASTGSARVEQALTLSLLSNEWQTLAWPAAGALVASDLADLEGRVTTNGGFHLTVRGAGRHVVRLSSVVPVSSDARATRPTWVAEVPLPPAASVTGTVHAFAEVEEVALTSGAIARESDGRGGQRFVGFPGSVCRLELRGRSVSPTRSALPLRLTATSATLAAVGRTRMRVRAFVTAQVVQGQLERLVLDAPPGLSVVTVEAEPPAGWDAAEGTVTVTPLAPVEGILRLKATLAGPALERLASPLLRPRGAARETLVSAVTAEGDGLVELEGPGQVRAPDERETAALAREFREAARFPVVVTDPAAPPRWVVSWPEKGELLAAQVDRLVIDVLLGQAGSAAYQLFAVVRNAGVTSLTITPPPGFELATASRDGWPVQPGRDGEGLVVPLTSTTTPQVLHLSGVVALPAPAEGARLSVATPALSAPAGRLEYRLVLPPGFAYAASNEHGRPVVAPDLSQPARAANAPVVGEAQQQAAARKNLSLVQQVTTSRESVGGLLPRLFEVPSGYRVVTGGWSVLSATPSPVTVEMKGRSEKWGWL